MKHIKDESGQILIIILLVLVVAVSIVLSLSARSLTDIRTTTRTEQSNRAYFAAEAGIERALQQIKDDPNVVSGTQITGSTNPLGNQAQYAGVIEVTGGSPSAFYYEALKDQTVQVNLKPNINQADFNQSDFGLNSGTMSIFWHVGLDADPRAALEISVLRVNAAGNYVIDRAGCDPNVARQSSNGLNCTGWTGSGMTPLGVNCATSVQTSNKGTINFCYTLTFNTIPAAGYKAIMMRIRPLYSNDAIAVRYNSGNLPQQGYKITSTGSSTEGASRKLEVYRSFPSLPTVFDFVLYNGSNNSLTKP